ncbi:ATP-dependent Clp protease adapter ClpS [Rothia aerolata]|uniref:ATP-dependent Clp protease adapter protein ClpS n=1 Tax=Rothia aerolata TaxID=1812262 RepID=A0A917MQY6_9MICC|nr:ATP-dependent Clp protease adapter ClpS [Rothia aerolata]GGH59065.1 ATP-dependent Clp protease adapter protein ClpS [Rothia aerolata]
MSVAPDEALDLREETDTLQAPDTPWQVIVWNDPVNLMSYVTYVFRTYFGFGQEKAQKLMMAVHTEGKAVVFTGSREEAETHTNAMHGWGLWATFERAE